MKQSRHNQGITRIEMFAVISVVGVLLFFFVMAPCALGNTQKRAARTLCASNLKQVGLAMQLFAESHHGNFPWAVSTNEGGSLEFTNSALVYKHFAAASNHLNNPRILACLSDRDRERSLDFLKFSNANLSYFVSLDAARGSNGAPQSLLAGDRNITGGIAVGPVRLYMPNSEIGFTKDIHKKVGNILLLDGSVQQATSEGTAKPRVGPSAIRLAIP
jgi:competence protein ComGC